MVPGREWGESGSDIDVDIDMDMGDLLEPDDDMRWVLPWPWPWPWVGGT